MSVVERASGTRAPGTEAPPVSKLLDEVVNKTLALNPLVGTLTERLAYWKETNPAWAKAGLNGWDNMDKCIMACSMADGMQVHPALFMNGNWCFVASGGKLIVIPKVPFILAMCRARVSGFRLEVVQDDTEACDVKIYNGRDWHKYRYTIEDARRQGLLNTTRGNAWSSGNTREMLQWKAIRRCADLACPEVMYGMASPPEDSEDMPEAEPAKVTALAPAPIPYAEPDWMEALRTEIRATYGGGLTGKRMLEKVNIIRGAMNKDPLKAGEITDEAAREVTTFLREKYPHVSDREKLLGATGSGATEGATPKKKSEEPAAGNSAPASSEIDPAGAAALEREAAFENDDDAVPEPDDVPLEEEPAPDDTPEQRAARELARIDEQDGKLETLQKHVKLAKEKFPKVVFVKESPEGSGKHYFVHRPIMENLGFRQGVKVMEGGAAACDADTYRKLVRAMRGLGIVDTDGISR